MKCGISVTQEFVERNPSTLFIVTNDMCTGKCCHTMAMAKVPLSS